MNRQNGEGKQIVKTAQGEELGTMRSNKTRRNAEQTTVGQATTPSPGREPLTQTEIAQELPVFVRDAEELEGEK